MIFSQLIISWAFLKRTLQLNRKTQLIWFLLVSRSLLSIASVPLKMLWYLVPFVLSGNLVATRSVSSASFFCTQWASISISYALTPCLWNATISQYADTCATSLGLHRCAWRHCSSSAETYAMQHAFYALLTCLLCLVFFSLKWYKKMQKEILGKSIRSFDIISFHQAMPPKYASF